jgi:hypothetical protein
METVCPDSQSFLDPFCGSGTVLYEALQRGRSGLGAEVNPAAWHLANLASFAALTKGEKHDILVEMKAITHAAGFSDELFISEMGPREIIERISSIATHPYLRRALAAAVLLGMGDERELSHRAISKGAFIVLSLLNELVRHDRLAECSLADARKLPFASESVEAVITSPPYINVFNYHQNYRAAAEILGWRPLEAAQSEIGANRKHRGNRFLTVVQYCMDMAQCIDEIARTMKLGSPLVITLGRTSNVLGVAFPNGALIRKLLEISGAFSEIDVAERVFTGRFGDRIYEDVLISRRTGTSHTNLEDARKLGLLALKGASKVPEKNRGDLTNAIDGASAVQPSPILNISVPPAFAEQK